MKIILALFFATAYTVAAQPQVPHKMEFAGMTLTIRDDARREIQKDVNALTQSPRHHAIKVERARTYFPIIEKVFEEERVPDDFKYLVLQESALIPDAVSSSNAVGFWQFKDFTAAEMGLRVDKSIDERMNIVSSTRAAARYIKKNNFFFNNWVYALQAYQMGAGGVMKSERETESGSKHMEITSSTYWYVKKFLAHKIAFEEDVKGKGQIEVLSYETRSKKDLSDIAKEVSVEEADLKAYNKWAKNGSIPDDRTYIVMIPVVGNRSNITIPADAIATAVTPAAVPHHNPPKGSTSVFAKSSVSQIKINGIDAIKANESENPAQLAGRADVDLSSFLKWNDISISDRILPGEYYLLGKKRRRSVESFHKVATGDNLWKVSQQYGVQIKRLKKYNRISSDKELTGGMMLWLSAKKPAESDAIVPPEDVIQVDDTNTFAWSASPDRTEAALDSAPIVASTLPASTASTSPALDTHDPTPQQEPSAEAPLPHSNEIKVVVQDSIPTEIKDMAVPHQPTQHIVVAGETLYGIATQHKASVMDLVSWNKLNLQDGIRPGQVIKLVDDQPIALGDKAPEKRPKIEHEVKSTDTLYSVARKYNVTIQELMEWNDKKDFTLSVGEKLKIQTK